MRFNSNSRLFLFNLTAATAVLVSAGAIRAQVTEVVVGITPNCPYGFPGCWPGAKEALEHLDDVLIVANYPDVFNCTARVTLKRPGLPDIVKWSEQFKSLVGGAHTFRGVEVTIRGSVIEEGKQLSLKTPDLEKGIILTPLKNKLQWNFKKGAARQAEPDEAKAYEELAAKKKNANDGEFQVEVTGPLRKTDQGVVLEVREFFVLSKKIKH